MGIFDEGCMGMYNAIVPDDLLMAVGVYKERLSQAALYYAMTEVPDDEAAAVRAWLDAAGMRFDTGTDPATELTDAQILDQCRMYIAALRIADEFGCDLVGIQYQQGLKDLAPASDLAEGLLNNSDRPPVANAAGEVIRAGAAAAALQRGRRVRRASTPSSPTGCGPRSDQPPETTLHDIRWGDVDRSGSTDEYVWVFEISGAVPPAHLDGGLRRRRRRAPAADVLPPRRQHDQGREPAGRGRVVAGARRARRPRHGHRAVPGRAPARRGAAPGGREATTSQWPMMSAVLYGIDRDQLMARHQSNHIQVAYATDADGRRPAGGGQGGDGRRARHHVHLCGDDAEGVPLARSLAAGG